MRAEIERSGCADPMAVAVCGERWYPNRLSASKRDGCLKSHYPYLFGDQQMSQPNVIQRDQSTDVELDYMELDNIIEKEFGSDKENLIMILQAIQRRYNYVPRPSLSYLSVKVGVPLSQIYGVATFYSTFSLEPRGRNIISICLGTACHVRGADRVKERIEENLKISDGQTTPDNRFTLESVRCIGCCSLGPVVKINEDMHGRISTDEVKKVLDQYE
jgi:NADH:ubiquinone oxidoreductase subunit E